MITVKWIHIREDRHRVELDESELNPVVAAALEAWKAGDRAPLDAWIAEVQSDDTFVGSVEVPTAGVGVYGRPDIDPNTQEVEVTE